MHSTPQLGGYSWNIVMPFGTEKLEWLGYQTVKIFKIRLLVLTESTNVTDGHTERQTDGHRMTTLAAVAWHRAAKIE